MLTFNVHKYQKHYATKATKACFHMYVYTTMDQVIISLERIFSILHVFRISVFQSIITV